MFREIKKRIEDSRRSEQDIKNKINDSRRALIEERVSSCTTINEVFNVLVNQLQFPLYSWDLYTNKVKYVDKREFYNSFKSLVEYPKKNKFVSKSELVYAVSKFLAYKNDSVILTVERILLKEDPSVPDKNANVNSNLRAMINTDLREYLKINPDFKSVLPSFVKYDNLIPRDKYKVFGKLFHDFRLMSSILDKNSKRITKNGYPYNLVSSSDLNSALQLADEMHVSVKNTEVGEYFLREYPNLRILITNCYTDKK